MSEMVRALAAAALVAATGCSALSDFDRFTRDCIEVPESCNDADDDCDGLVDEDFDKTIDDINCGTCGTVCEDPTPFCGDGVCTDRCVLPRVECPTGDCVLLQSDPDHCGGCGLACPDFDNAMRQCADQMCTFACNGSFADCNDTFTDGCEIDTTSARLDCGGCGLACAFDCEDGACDEVREVSVGAASACAILDAGRVACWGQNPDGQLGIDPAAVDRTSVPLLSGVPAGPSSISMGVTHACAIYAGEVHCWGSNALGQLGNATAGDTFAPVRAGTLTGVTRVVAWQNRTCAIAGGELHCWGDNLNRVIDMAQPGSATIREPVRQMLPSPVTDVGLGIGHGCAIADGDVYCWGLDAREQVSAGAGGSGYVRVDLGAGVGVPTSIATGVEHNCVLTDAAQILCWGEWQEGQMWPCTDACTGVQNLSFLYSGLMGAGVGLAAGQQHTCLWTDMGELVCWGNSLAGRLGAMPGGCMPGLPQPPCPQVVFHLGSFYEAVSAGIGTTCALRRDATPGPQLECWGAGLGHLLGRGSMPRDPGEPGAVLPLSGTAKP